jgi:2-keto-4-pentenoate hydratase/2-oxohepta-3-ene-1,7-dioic acid hydratase in catechol pathway
MVTPGNTFPYTRKHSLNLVVVVSDQIFTVRQTVSFLSQATTLEPGSIILTGTPKGVGFARKPAVVLKNGDDCRVWIGNGIGTLINPVIEEGRYRAML